MANVNYEAKIVLCVSVKIIVYINIILYLLLFAGFFHFAIGMKAKVNSAEFVFAIFLMLLSLAMFIATNIMHFGVPMQRSDYIFPCIFMTLPTCFFLMVYLFFVKDLMLTVVLSVCLIYMVFSWYPLYVFYKKFLSQIANASAPQPSAPMEDQTLNPTVDPAGYGFRPLPTVVPDFPNAVPPYTAIDNCQSPPSYESAMGVEATLKT